MTPTTAHSFIQEDLAARLIHCLRQTQVVLFPEMSLARMRTPQQATNMHTPPRPLREHRTHFRTRTVETLVSITLPVREVHTITGRERQQHLQEATEIGRPVDQHLDMVSLRPRRTVAPPTIDPRGRVSALMRRQEPLIKRHEPTCTRFLGCRNHTSRPATGRVSGRPGERRSDPTATGRSLDASSGMSPSLTVAREDVVASVDTAAHMASETLQRLPFRQFGSQRR